MKQIFIVGHGGPEKLRVREAPDPRPAGGEIRIRVQASGLNFAESSRARACIPTHLGFPASSAMRFRASWTL